MKIFDLHQDLMTHVRFAKQFGQVHQTSFADIAASDIDLVVATAFPLPPDNNQLDKSVPALITEELQMYKHFLQKNPTWKLVETASDLETDKQKILLHLEGLNVFDGSLNAWRQLDDWQVMGVRSVGTHWNVENPLGGGTLQPTQPLTTLGAEVIEYLEANHMVFDMAHMGRQSFADAIKVTTRPLYVSHGNADAICSNVRNYTDEQLKAIAETDGVIGVFFANTFVTGNGSVGQIADVVRHFDYIRDLIGVRHLAIGSDFGGIITGSVKDLTEVSDFPNLFMVLLQAGYSQADIEAIAYKNAARVLRQHLG